MKEIKSSKKIVLKITMSMTRGFSRPRVEEERVQDDMFSKDTSVLSLAQWGSEKGRGVFCDNKAIEYKVWQSTYIY